MQTCSIVLCAAALSQDSFFDSTLIVGHEIGEEEGKSQTSTTLSTSIGAPPVCSRRCLHSSGRLWSVEKGYFISHEMEKQTTSSTGWTTWLNWACWPMRRKNTVEHDEHIKYAAINLVSAERRRCRVQRLSDSSGPHCVFDAARCSAVHHSSVDSWNSEPTK